MKKQIPSSLSVNPYLLLSIVLLHVIALAVKGISTLELLALGCIGLVVALISYRSIFIGLLIAATEIFVGGHGHLISAHPFGFPLSLRMVIFLAVMSAWVVLVLQKKLVLNFSLKQNYPFIILFVAIIIGALLGLTNGNSLLYIFDDANGYLALGFLLPLLSIDWDDMKKTLLLQSLITSAVWLSVGTLILSYCFTHFPESVIRPLYVFIRDTRLSEITLQSITDSSGTVTQPIAQKFFGESGYWYRIFMQSQLFVAVAWLTLVAYMLGTKEKIINYRYTGILIILFSAALFLSQSRSFFVGNALAALGIIVVTLYTRRKEIKIFIQRIGILFLLGLASLSIVWLTVVFPFPPRPDTTHALFYATSVDTNRDVAVTSRWSLLQMMNEKIKSSPIVGKGFGTTITYVSDDPTVRETNPNGLLETYRFEWGYQDIWIKMGLLGIIAFGAYIVVIAKTLLYTWKYSEDKWVILGLAASLGMLFVTHIFSPYLNHPIGSIMMLLILPFIYKPKIAT
jgi:hypothetical protein